jgi:hypothetical protein
MRSPAHSVILAAALAITSSIAALELSGCGSKPTKAEAIERYGEELRIAVSANVSDEPRRARMLALVYQLDALQLHFNRQTGDFIAAYRKLNSGYDSTRPEFNQLFADFRAERVKARSEALELHFKLASTATTDEWKAIGKAEERLYEKVTAARTTADDGT